MTQPDLATASNNLIVVGVLALALAVAGIVGLLWCVAGGVFAGLGAAGVEALVLGVAAGRVAAGAETEAREPGRPRLAPPLPSGQAEPPAAPPSSRRSA